jgi:hypothetical protein
MHHSGQLNKEPTKLQRSITHLSSTGRGKLRLHCFPPAVFLLASNQGQNLANPGGLTSSQTLAELGLKPYKYFKLLVLKMLPLLNTTRFQRRPTPSPGRGHSPPREGEVPDRQLEGGIEHPIT